MRFPTALTIAALATTVAPALSAQATMPADSLAHARMLTDWFFTARHDSVVAYFPEEERAEITTAELQTRLEQLTGRVGLESEVIEEKFVKRNGLTQYWRTSKYSNYDEPVLFRWVFDKQGRIAGMGVGPASQAPPIEPD